MRTAERTPDPQWDFALLIRGALDSSGSYSTEVDTRDAQSLVDLRWAALQAGRLLGVRVKVDVRDTDGQAGPIATATVHRLEPPDPETDTATPGLEKLLRCVMEAQAATRGGQTSVPTPRAPQDA
jgi:hypothetical protein